MRLSQLEQKLVAGESVTGRFAPAGADFATPGVLKWSSDEGALLELADRTHPWPDGEEDGFTVHGTPYDGEAITLMDCMVRRWSFNNITTHISSSTLAIGEHTEPGEGWPKANFRPGTLHEWIPETGLSIGGDDKDDEDDAATFVLTYRQPVRRVVQVPDGEVSIYPSGYYGWSYSPNWKIETAMTFGASPTDALTITEHFNHYGGPLRAFCIFVADKPDDLLLESYYAPETKRRIAVLRPNRHPSRTEWRPGNDRYLFQAEHVADVGETVRRWLDVWHRSVPSLGLLAETIEQGRTYSAPRFLTLYTAAETYFKAIHASYGPWSPRSLAEIADVDPALTGATRDAIAMIGRLRSYHAHGARLDPGQDEQQALLTYDATRRLHALLQVCVMRDLGMPTDVIEQRLVAHYRGWPLP